MVQPEFPRQIPRLTAANSPSATARWQAVVNRDARATSFVYAVLTTKIYCRPSCPARLARRANVDFYDTPSDAEQAGFRPCKRCKPQSLRVVNPQYQLIQRACEAIQAQVESGSKPALRTLADEANLTPCYFHRLFKKIKGVTPGQYAAMVLNQSGGEPLDENTPTENSTMSGPWTVDVPCHSAKSDILDGAGVANGGDVGLWNDFDVLIAAEANWDGGHWIG